MVDAAACQGFIRLSDRRIGEYLESRREQNSDLPNLLLPVSLTTVEETRLAVRAHLPRAQFGSAEKPVTAADVDFICGGMLPRTAPLDMRGPLVDDEEDEVEE